jgi:hypothetical protein
MGATIKVAPHPFIHDGGKKPVGTGILRHPACPDWSLNSPEFSVVSRSLATSATEFLTAL